MLTELEATALCIGLTALNLYLWGYPIYKLREKRRKILARLAQ